MRQRRYRPIVLLTVLVGVLLAGLLCWWGYTTGWLHIIPTKTERELGRLWGIEPSLEAFNAYIDAHLVEGSARDEVIMMLGQIEGHTFSATPIPGSVKDPDAQCYLVGFYQVFHTRTLDRLVCFDKVGQVIRTIHVLTLE